MSLAIRMPLQVILPSRLFEKLKGIENEQALEEKLFQNPEDLYSYVFACLKMPEESRSIFPGETFLNRLIQKLEVSIKEGNICQGRIVKICSLARNILPAREVTIRSGIDAYLVKNIPALLLASLPSTQNPENGEVSLAVSHVVFKALKTKDYQNIGSFNEAQLCQLIHALRLQNDSKLFESRSGQKLSEVNLSTFLHVAFQLRSCKMIKNCLNYIKKKTDIEFKVFHPGTCEITVTRPTPALHAYLAYFPMDKIKIILAYQFSPYPEETTAMMEFVRSWGGSISILELSNVYSFSSLTSLRLTPKMSAIITEKQSKMDQTLQELIDLCPALENLCIRQCNIKKLFSINGLLKLKHLELWDCRGLRQLPALECLSRLETLSLRDCHELQDYPEIAHLENLKSIDTITNAGLNNEHRLKAFLSILEADPHRARKLSDSECIDFKTSHLVSISSLLFLIDRKKNAEKDLINYFLKYGEQKTRKYVIGILMAIPEADIQDALSFLIKFEDFPELKERAFKYMYLHRRKESLNDFKDKYGELFTLARFLSL